MGSMSCCHQWQRGRLLMKLSLMPTWTCSGPTGCHWCHQVPLAVPWTPYGVGLCLEAPCTQLTRSLYPQGWILEPPPCWKCWRPRWWCWRPWRWWCWRPWRWSWSLDGRWRNPRWVRKALMTYSVVIHAIMMSWYPRRRRSISTEDILTLGGPCVWLKSLVWSWSPLLTFDIVRWHDEGTHTHMMVVWHLDTLMMILVLLKVGWRCWHLMTLKMMTLGRLLHLWCWWYGGHPMNVNDMAKKQ